MKLKPQTGHVYYLKDFTAPKVFNGLFFECLLTTQRIPANEPIVKDLGHLNDYEHIDKIYKPERFNIVQGVQVSDTTKSE